MTQMSQRHCHQHNAGRGRPGKTRQARTQIGLGLSRARLFRENPPRAGAAVLPSTDIHGGRRGDQLCEDA